MKDRVHRDFAKADIDKIADTYHNWRGTKSAKWEYEDEVGFSKSANLEEVQKHDYVLTPWRYVGIVDEIDDGIPFEDKMNVLTAQLAEQMQKEKAMNDEIKEQLAKIGFKI